MALTAPSVTSALISSRQYHVSPPCSHSSSTSRRKPLLVTSKRERGTRPDIGCPALRSATDSSRPRACSRHCGTFRSQSTSGVNRPSGGRSEEHTSELQSHLNLVCRLLLEKKKKHRLDHYHHSQNNKKQHYT